MLDINFYGMTPKPTNATMSLQLQRIASELDSEKRTRAEANRAVIEELRSFRTDMNRNFNGDGDNPGILIRLDRIEQKNYDALKASLDEHEQKDNQRFEAITTSITEAKGFTKAVVIIGGGIITVIQILIAIFI